MFKFLRKIERKLNWANANIYFYKDNQDLMNDLEKEYFLNKQALRQEHELIISEIAKTAAQDRADYEREVTQESLRSYQSFVSGLGTVFSQISTMMSQSGEDSKALFYANQAVAIANAIVSTELAATNALKYSENMTLAQALVSQAAVRTVGYASVGIIAGQTIAGQAHDGIGYVPKSNEGTWLLKESEMVLNPAQADNFRWMVDAMSEMRKFQGSIAASDTKRREKSINVNVYGIDKSSVTTQASENEESIDIDIVVEHAVKKSLQAVYSDFDNGGPISSSSRARS